LMTSLLLAAAPAKAEVASWYAPGDGSGHKTASGEYFTGRAMTAAHRTLPFGTRVRLCHRGCVTVRINDRGPFVRGRQYDLSRAAAQVIGCGGVCDVRVVSLY